ncbi:MAG: (d)CMP kinase [Candidatus Bipolaricaulota bacterium]|nr:(d)CMP kinase [Candidatus Bipolaricaulota bacterium]MDW8030693.1 (d)CMP kinase [Candidatus Bipolaricaulota bacterium]
MQIAIDGPAGSGKTSVARALAKRFGCLLINTGAMYRAVALALSQGLKLSEIQIEVCPDERIILNGQDVTERLYTPEMDELASQTAARPEVRAFLIAQQRVLAQHRDVVMEGRDIGSVVLPTADVKLYLDASPEERARRRCRERPGQSYEEVLAQLRARDARDSQGFGRLQITPETIVIHTNGRPLDEIIAEAVQAVATALQRRSTSGKLSG